MLEDCDNDYELEFVQESENGLLYMSLELNCEIDEEDVFECYGHYNLEVCDEDVDVEDGFGTFDLNLIFDNCPNVSFHLPFLRPLLRPFLRYALWHKSFLYCYLLFDLSGKSL